MDNIEVLRKTRCSSCGPEFEDCIVKGHTKANVMDDNNKLRNERRIRERSEIIFI
jgi:hypothetical protein